MAAIFLMLAHGLVSSALFIAVTLLYERHHTRLVKYYRGDGYNNAIIWYIDVNPSIS